MCMANHEERELHKTHCLANSILYGSIRLCRQDSRRLEWRYEEKKSNVAIGKKYLNASFA